MLLSEAGMLHFLLRRYRSTTSVTSLRQRATYYQPPKRWPPKFFRRLLLRYPLLPHFTVLTLCALGLFFPVGGWLYKAVTMDAKEFEAYREEQNKLIRMRQKFGTNLYFPFYNGRSSAAGKPKEEQDSTWFNAMFCFASILLGLCKVQVSSKCRLRLLMQKFRESLVEDARLATEK